jgi:signal transduction histidine kinase
VNLAAQRLGAGGCILHQFDLENQLITQIANYGMQGIFPKGGTRAFDAMKPSGGDSYIKATLEKRPTYRNYPPLPERLDEIRLDQSIPEHIKKERIALRTKFASSFSVPLFIQDRPYGGLVFYYIEPQDFSDEQVRLGLAFADQMAVAIENARLLQEAEQRRKVAESLVEVFSVLNSSGTDQEIFDFLTRRSSELLSADACMLYRMDEGVISQLSQYNLPDALASLKSGELFPGGKNQQLAQLQPVPVSNTEEYLRELLSNPDMKEFQRMWYEGILENFKAYLGIPMVVAEKLFGGLVFYYKHQRVFSNEDIQVSKVMGGYVSLAIENALLRTQTAEVAAISERNRLARDLHDAVSQTLFSASLIAEVLPKLWERNPQAGREKLDELRLLTRGALSEMRTLLLELRPGTLVDMDLGDLYRHLANAFTGRNRLLVELHIDGQIDPPANVKEVFYRVAQEALNNITKHAGATGVEMSLLREEGQVVLRVQDNGRGFDQQQVSPQSMGLKIMQERADSIGARLFVQSILEAGTCIDLSWKDN